MLHWSPATRIYLGCGVTDMRLGYRGLYGQVQTVLGEDPTSGHVFVFCNRRRNRIKVYYWDGSGFWICAKRLEKGCFSWPSEGQQTISADALAMLLGGLEWPRAKSKNWYRK